MAPNWLSRRQSGWGQSASEGPTTLVFTAIVIVLLLVGAVLGFGLSTLRPEATPDVDPAALRVIDTSLAGVANADYSQEGATKAASSFILGLPDLSLKPVPDQASEITDLTEPAAGEEVRTEVQALVTSIQTQVIGPPGSPRQGAPARVLILPATYRTEMIDPNRARVVVWRLTIFLDPQGQRFQSTWTTDDIGLTWSDRWRVDSMKTTEGPTPPYFNSVGRASTYADIVPIINGAFGYHPALAPLAAESGSR